MSMGAQSSRADLDRWLVLITVLLAGTGLIMVLSASQVVARSYGSPYYFFERQAIGAGLGLLAMAALSRVDYHRLRAFALPLAAVAAIGMLVVLLPHVGVDSHGARRWLNLGPLGSVQPSEFAKLGFAVFLADWVTRRGPRLESFSDGLVPFVVLMGGALLLLLLEHDLGTAVVMAAIFLAALFAGGGSKVHLALLLAVFAVAMLLVTISEPYRVARWNAYLNPFHDSLGAGFQSTQALVALGSGGPFGVGLGNSMEKFYWLPEAHTDFIFAIIGEETGLWGTTAVLAGFILLAVRGYRIASRAPDAFGVVLATTITTWISFQAVMNMGTVTDTLPIAGVPLPFISYGGTAVSAGLAAVGVLLNVSRQGLSNPGRTIRPENGSNQGSDATVDSRRGDRRTPVPGARRRPSLSR